ncbi:DUF2797 domain-containing protein [Kitasatospora sp. NPDC054939]
MNPQQPGWIATGLHWQDGRPLLTATNGRRSHERAVTPGTAVGWRLTGPRRCTGAWLAGRTERTPCPHRAAIEPDGGAVQCPACQSVDRGLALARDQILDDGRSYHLYLAWFGEGLLKVGLTAEQRGSSRLLEQGALVWTLAARGPLPAVRRAELTVAASGLARERFKSRAKAEGWWQRDAWAGGRAVLAAARRQAHGLLAGHHGLDLLPDHPITDHLGLYGLADGAPEGYLEVTALTDGAVLAGTLRAPVGRHLFLDHPGHALPLLLDTRRLTGWTLSPVAGAGPTPAGVAGVGLVERCRPAETGAQGELF